MQFVVEISASFPDRIVDLSPYLTNVVVNFDYRDRIMPMWAFSFLMPYEIKNTLQQEDFTLPFRLYSIKKTSSDNEDPYATDEDIIYDSLIYEDEIIEYSKTQTNVKQITDDIVESGATNAISTIPFSISGLSKQIMETNSSILNGNYRNTTSLNALQASLQDLNNKINIVVSDENLVTEYQQVLIPPMNLIPAVRHLIRYYPIYNTGTGIFFNNRNELHLFTNTFNSLQNRVDVEIIENSQEVDYDPKEYQLNKVGNNYWTYKTNITPPFETVKKVNDNILGIDKVVYSYDDIFKLKDGNVTDRDNIYEKKRIYWDPLGEETNLSILENAYKINRVTAFVMYGVSPDIFNQYTYFNFTGDEAINYLKGRYSVVSKIEAYISSEANRRIFDMEMSLVLENIIE